MQRRRSTLLAAAVSLALVVGLGVARGAPDFDLAADDDRAKLVAIEKDAAAGNEGAVFALEALFARCARTGALRDGRNSPGDGLVETTDEKTGGARLRALRECVLDVAAKLPPELAAKLVQAQRDAIATERQRASDDSRDLDESLIRRYPLAPDARAIAERLASRAFETGDELGAASLDRFARRIARAQGAAVPVSFHAVARRALALARRGWIELATGSLDELSKHPAPPKNAGAVIAQVKARIDAARARRDALDARRPPEGQVPDLLASFPFSRKDQLPIAGTRRPQTPLAARLGDRIFASDGSRVLCVDARAGELEGRLPQDDENVDAPAQDQVPGVVSALGDVVLAPLFFESFLLPARQGSPDGKRRDGEDADPSIRGGWYSLFAFDARSQRLLWFDGDEGVHSRALEDGPRGRPAGAEGLDERTWKRLASSHVAGRPLQDGRRVYVPLVTALSESQVWVAAYERRTGESQSLVLVPAWQTFVALSSQAFGPGFQGGAMPPTNPRLAIDPEGRIILQTDLGVLAALDARTGQLDWVVRFGEEEMRGRGTRARGTAFISCNDPPVIVPGDGTRPSIVVVPAREEERFVGVSCEDGTVLWRSDPWSSPGGGVFTNESFEAPRILALAHDVVIGYGGSGFTVLDGRTGASLLESASSGRGRLPNPERPVGPAVHAGKGMLLVPMSTGRARKLRWLLKRTDNGTPKVVVLGVGEELVLQGVEGPASLIVLEGRLVATTTQRVLVYSWVKPGE